MTFSSSPHSHARTIAGLPPNLSAAFFATLTDLEAAHLLYEWRFWARREQVPPEGPWETWLVLAGRGFGKTRTGAEWVRREAESGRRRRIALVGATLRDVRKTMVEGEAGITGISPPWFRPLFVKSELRLVWPNGVIADLYSAERPDRLRGPNHDAAWADELAAWKHLDGTWDNLELTLRAGSDPKRVVTTTPKPRPGLKRLIADPTTIVTRGSTSANADNLARGYVTRLERRYAGTRLGRQEMEAELLEEAEGALWSLKHLDRLRAALPPELTRVVVAIDPAVTSIARSAETGIVVAGLGADGIAYVLKDLSGRHKPEEWASRAISAFRAHRADRILGETNNGGDLVEATLRAIDSTIPYRAVTASRGKRIRAEPIAALYEQGRVRHVGNLSRLEDQMVSWQPGEGASPDRVDALVWALTDLMLGEKAFFYVGR
ncbi:MAG: ATP-binding protein [Alphaproteobacteria bacterium]|nr:ATP-binding protein [Alphaproteobacteria bacterium]